MSLWVACLKVVLWDIPTLQVESESPLLPGFEIPDLRPGVFGEALGCRVKSAGFGAAVFKAAVSAGGGGL